MAQPIHVMHLQFPKYKAESMSRISLIFFLPLFVLLLSGALLSTPVISSALAHEHATSKSEDKDSDKDEDEEDDDKECDDEDKKDCS